MTHFSFDIVGFDLDGTLLDTSGDLAAAVNHALASVDRPPLDVEQVKPMIGGGARHMLKQGLTATGGYDEAMLDPLHATLLAYYEAHICVLTKPYPGAIDALDALAARVVAELGALANAATTGSYSAQQALDTLAPQTAIAPALGRMRDAAEDAPGGSGDGSSGSGDSKILRASAPFVGHVFSLLFNCCRPDPKILPSAQSLQLIQVLQSCENNLF